MSAIHAEWNSRLDGVEVRACIMVSQSRYLDISILVSSTTRFYVPTVVNMVTDDPQASGRTVYLNRKSFAERIIASSRVYSTASSTFSQWDCPPIRIASVSRSSVSTPAEELALPRFGYRRDRYRN